MTRITHSFKLILIELKTSFNHRSIKLKLLNLLKSHNLISLMKHLKKFGNEDCNNYFPQKYLFDKNEN